MPIPIRPLPTQEFRKRNWTPEMEEYFRVLHLAVEELQARMLLVEEAVADLETTVADHEGRIIALEP